MDDGLDYPCLKELNKLPSNVGKHFWITLVTPVHTNRAGVFEEKQVGR